METVTDHPWRVSFQQAKATQMELAKRIVLEEFTARIVTVCAVDVSYGRFDHSGYAVLGCFSVAFDSQSARYDCRIERIYTAISRVDFPYVPGYLSFREIPILLPLFRQLPERPDLLLVDGAGIAHPRGIGLAAHLGVIFNLPAIGCAKSRLSGEYSEPANRSGAASALTSNNAIIGAVLRTKNNTKPIFISPGHRMDVASALAIMQKFRGKYRIPEPLRIVDLVSKSLRKHPELVGESQAFI